MGAAASGWSQTAPAGTLVQGQVVFNGLAVPGATVTAEQGSKKVVGATDGFGYFTLTGLADGPCTLTVAMQFFEPARQDVVVSATATPTKIELKMLSGAKILELASAAPKVEPPSVVVAKVETPATGAPAKKKDDTKPVDEPKPRSEAENNDGFLINGQSNNAATSKYALDPAFGNTRSSKGQYNYGLAARIDNSALDARPDSLTGDSLPKSSYDRLTLIATFGGPIRIPHLMPRGPNFFIAYQWTRDADASTLTGLVPTAAERTGNFAGATNALGQPVTVVNPTTGLPFAGGQVPVSPQAAALLSLYPTANVVGSSLYNYQSSVLSTTHDDAMQTRLDRRIGNRDHAYGSFSFESARTSSTNLFGFVDRNDSLGMNSNANWGHRFRQRIYSELGVQFSRYRILSVPFFDGRQNVSAAAGITGNLQDSADWGPPNLGFAGGTAGLGDETSAFNRNRTTGVSESVEFNRGKHEFTVGGDFRRQEFNVLAQQNPRGSFDFTGAATGLDLADFVYGVPDTASIAYGNADKYIRGSQYDAYVKDDWRLRPELTLNIGARWEYGSPPTELKGRLVNLDILPGFTAVVPVLASAPTGPLTGIHYPTSLIQPDKADFQPRIGLSWRPIAGSTLVVRAGYGIYADSSGYRATASAMDQQYPLSTSLNVSNGPGCNLTLANGFLPCGSTTPDNFAIDPNFRVGYAQTWQVSAQRDLPAALVGTISYSGVKGTRGVQEFLPNTVPIGGTLTGAPVGFVYRTSGGDSTRESGQVQLRRRLKSGITASVQYTYSKSIDDDAQLGGQGPVSTGLTTSSSGSATIAQNWLNLRGERALSTFDQRHLLNASAQYTSGQGLGGGSLMTGWRGATLKEWTIVTSITAGSGLPETPIYFATVPGTGFTGTIRPNLTGASVTATTTPGAHLNAAAYTAPTAGQWGDARRDSITGPAQFSMNGSFSRTFRLKDGFNLDIRLDGTNVLNHVVYSSWNTIVNGSTFGAPASANGMRTVQITTRLRY
jgi:hypothetical protein